MLLTAICFWSPVRPSWVESDGASPLPVSHSCRTSGCRHSGSPSSHSKSSTNSSRSSNSSSFICSSQEPSCRGSTPDLFVCLLCYMLLTCALQEGGVTSGRDFSQPITAQSLGRDITVASGSREAGDCDVISRGDVVMPDGLCLSPAPLSAHLRSRVSPTVVC